jgi:hypothetical protein
MDAHQAEAVRGVRAPILVRPEPHVPVIVRFLFVVPAEGVAPGVLVEEDPRNEAPSGQCGSRLRRRAGSVSSGRHCAFVGRRKDLIAGRAIVR